MFASIISTMLAVTTMIHALIVIDDDPNIRKIFSNILIKAGYEVDAVDSIEKAEPLLNQKKYAVAIIDRMLPGESGEAFIQRYTFCETVPMMVTASKIDDDKIVALMEQGLLFVLRKPVSIGKLIICVKHAVQLYVYRTSTADLSNIAEDMLKSIADAETSLKKETRQG